MGCGNSSPAKHVTNNNSSSKRSRDPAEFSSTLSVESVPEDDKRKSVIHFFIIKSFYLIHHSYLIYLSNELICAADFVCVCVCVRDQELWRCVRGVAYRPEQHTPSPDWLTQRASDRLAVPQETAVGGLTLVLMKARYGGGMTQREGVC
ncbi:uncharacterized protein LOC102082896 isoform X2 [Oreochromis niloticus]|uniref:uncharacterized protein LOC102082896 isoform X2 n=1 Tax=Oreochromis niloticus TaxID=8128 RepID=UPI000674376E|nr:uncharacterized protein LOC102082896 isoform X2 [Oreochromis niloticus]